MCEDSALNDTLWAHIMFTKYRYYILKILKKMQIKAHRTNCHSMVCVGKKKLSITARHFSYVCFSSPSFSPSFSSSFSS